MYVIHLRHNDTWSKACTELLTEALLSFTGCFAIGGLIIFLMQNLSENAYFSVGIQIYIQRRI